MTLFGSDVGVDQVTHRWLVEFEVDVVATGHSDLGTHFGIVVHFLLDLGDLLGIVACLR